jgi:hypothetical protein
MPEWNVGLTGGRTALTAAIDAWNVALTGARTDWIVARAVEMIEASVAVIAGKACVSVA